MPVSVIFFTVADFNAFNDSYGYVTGDECLQRIAEAATQSVTGPRHLVARYRGTEFIAMLPELGAEQAMSAKDALRTHLEHLELGLCLQFGVATAHPNEATSRMTLLALAKEALAHSKSVYNRS